LLGGYIWNTLILIIGVGLFSSLMGISSAWAISRYEIPFKKTFEWLLILPLAIPTYINAFAYSGLLDYAGPIRSLFRNQFGINEIYFDIQNIYGSMWVMGTVLYPYVYLSARTAFSRQNMHLMEVSSSLGISQTKTFFTIVLPIARPAIVAGLLLIIMETLNDYGTVKYYGVTTFTTGIFRSWLSLGDLQSAIYLASILMTTVFGFILLEKWQRGKAQYESNISSNASQLIKVKGATKFTLIGVCSFPILFGLAVPMFQLVYWTAFTWREVLDTDLIEIIKNSFGLAIGAALLIVLLAIALNYAVKMLRSKKWDSIAKITVLGYSVPGAVIAVGIMILIISIDKYLLSFLEDVFSIKIKLLITGSIFALIYAYLVRYFAVGFGPLEAAFKSLPHSFNEAGRSLGVKPIINMVKIDLPLLNKAIIAALLIVFVDVMKELPLTLILRPFNFSTLATSAFQYANDEMADKAAPASLLIIFIGMIPIFVLNRLIKKDL